VPSTAFLDYQTTNEDNYDVQAIITSPVIFKICVTKYAITQDWKIFGKCTPNPKINKFEDKYVKIFLRT
jgi:hypothetical protein